MYISSYSQYIAEYGKARASVHAQRKERKDERAKVGAKEFQDSIYAATAGNSGCPSEPRLRASSGANFSEEPQLVIGERVTLFDVFETYVACVTLILRLTHEPSEMKASLRPLST